MPSHFASPSAAKTAGLLEQTVLRLLPPDTAGRRRLAGADGGAAKITKAAKLEVEVVDQGVIWSQLIAAGVA